MLISNFALLLASATIVLCRTDALTAVSWAKGRLDVFGFADQFAEEGEADLFHKYYTMQGGWEPYNGKFENLGGPHLGPVAAVKAVSVSENHIDVLTTSNGTLWQRYWNAEKWEPKTWTELPLDKYEGQDTMGSVAIASWGENRIDIVAQTRNGLYVHAYWDGSQWNGWESPWPELEFESPPIIVCPEKNHFDVFGIEAEDGRVMHSWWDGEKYNDWVALDDNAPLSGWGGDLTASTWGNGSWDLWAIDGNAVLWHTFWRADSKEYYRWEDLYAGLNFVTTPEVVHWSPGHTDIVGASRGKNSFIYYHRYWTGTQWSPWNRLSPDFYSVPKTVSWGEGHYAIFGVDMNGELLVAMWNVTDWIDWQALGNVTISFSSRKEAVTPDGAEQMTLNGWKMGL